MEKLTNILESLLFVSGDAVAVVDIAEKLEITEKEVLDAAKKLQEKYDEDSGLKLLIFNKKLQFGSNKEYADAVATVLNPIKERELSRSMLETAAIIAYKQPVTRMDLEEIRGNSEYALQNLLKLEVVEVVGRKEAVGRPVLFGTTDKFLKRFQISSLDELPDYETLIAQINELHTKPDDNYLFAKDVYNEEEDPEYNKKTRKSDKAVKEKDLESNQTELASQSEKSDDEDDDFTIESSVAVTEDLDSDDNDEEIDEPEIDDEDYGDEEEEKDDSNYEDDDSEEDDFELGDVEDEELPDYLKGEDVEIIK